MIRSVLLVVAASAATLRRAVPCSARMVTAVTLSCSGLELELMPGSVVRIRVDYHSNECAAPAPSTQPFAHISDCGLLGMNLLQVAPGPCIGALGQQQHASMMILHFGI